MVRLGPPLAICGVGFRGGVYYMPEAMMVGDRLIDIYRYSIYS